MAKIIIQSLIFRTSKKKKKVIMSDAFGKWLHLIQLLRTKSFTNVTNETVLGIVDSLGGIEEIIKIILKKPHSLTLRQSITLDRILANLPTNQNVNNQMNIMSINITDDIVISKVFPYFKFTELTTLELISRHFCFIARNPNSLFEFKIDKKFCDYLSSKNLNETDLTRFSKVKKILIDFPIDISIELVKKIGKDIIKPSLKDCKKLDIVRCGEDNTFIQYFNEVVSRFKGRTMFFYLSSSSYWEVFDYCILNNRKLKSLVLDETECPSEIGFDVSKIVSFFSENKKKLCNLKSLWIRGDYSFEDFNRFNPERIMLTRQLLLDNSNSLERLELIYNDLLYPLWDGEYEYFYKLQHLNTLNLNYYITNFPKR